MLITKFNKLIHNKVIWAVFAVIISISMVGMFSPKARRRQPRPGGEMGSIFGKPVSRSQFNATALFSRNFQPMRDASEEELEQANEATWQRLAILGLAKKMNITVSDNELNYAIQHDSSFAVKGVFSPKRYKQLIEGQMHIKRSTYEAYLRQEMILRKMSAVVAQSLWVAPSEIEKSVAQLTDVFTIDVVDISYSNSVDNIKASEDDVKKYYDEHKGQFEIPEMRCVKYVDWPISNFLAKASVSELEIKVYYEDNIDDFARTDTTNSTEAYKPLEEVSGTISNKLAHEQAIDLAGEDAMLFTDDLSKKDYDNKITIEQIADKRKCTVHTSEYFSATGEVPGLNVSKSFVKSAFDLKKDVPEDSYSEAIIEKNAVYVMAIAAIKPPSIPPFKEIKEDVRKYADSLAKSEAFNKKVEDIRKKIKAAVATGTDISKLAKKLDLKIRSPKPFSIYDSMNDDDLSDIGPALLGLNKGEVSDPAPTATGAAIIYVKDRQPGDFALAESLKPEIARTIQSNRMQAHFVTWAKSVLKEARGEDESTTAADDGAEEDKDEANNS